MAKKKSATLSRASARPRVPAPTKAAQRPATAPTAGGVTKFHPVGRQRMTYSQSFKLDVVRHSLRLPATARIKPTCRAFPGIEPVQIRKWIRNLAPLALLVEQQQAAGQSSGAKCVPRAPGSDQPTRLPSPEREGTAKASNKAAPSRAAKPSARNRRASPPSQSVYRSSSESHAASQAAISSSISSSISGEAQHHIDLECIDHSSGHVYESLVPDGALDISRISSTSTSATATPPYSSGASPTPISSPTVHPHEPPRGSPRPCPSDSPAMHNSPILGPAPGDCYQLPAHGMMQRGPPHYQGVPPSQGDALSMRSLQLAQQAQQAVQHVKVAQAHATHYPSNQMSQGHHNFMRSQGQGQGQGGGNRMYPLPIRLGPSLLSNQYGNQYGSQFGSQFGNNPQFGGGNHQFHGFSPLHQQTSGPMHPGYGVVQHQAGAPPGYTPTHLQRAADVAETPAPLPCTPADSMEFEEAAKDLLLLCKHGV